MTAARGVPSTRGDGRDDPALRCHGHPPDAVTASLEHAPVPAVIVCLLDRRIVWHNWQAQASAHRHGDELVGKRFEDLIEDGALVGEALDRIQQGHTGFQRVSVACEAERESTTHELTCLALDHPAHEAPHAVVYARAVLAASRWHGTHAAQLNALTDPVNGRGLVALVSDGAGQVQSATEASIALFGVPVEDLLGRWLTELVEDPELIEELLRSVHERPNRAVSAWLTIREPGASAQPSAGGGRRVAMSVSHRLDEPSLSGLLWHKLPIDDPPINAPREGYSTEYAAFLERRLTQIGREVERAGLAVRTSGAVPERVLVGLERLSDREREVLDLLARGLRVPTIAERLFVSQSTVRNHVSALFRKLGVQSQAELIERILSPEGGDELA